MPVSKSGCEYRLTNCDSPAGYGMHFPGVLSNYNGMTAYIGRRGYTNYSFSN